MSFKVALVGNPNSGKTTLFNGLTGSNQYVGNWPGVTIEKKSGTYRSDHFEAEIIDLPGIYSLSTISLEEDLTADFVMKHEMDVIINIVDASNLERNLYLTYQLLDSGIPMVVALNCMDIIEKKLACLNTVLLEKHLGVPVIPITASKKQGLVELMRRVEVTDLVTPRAIRRYSEAIETTIQRFESITNNRFHAIRFFEDGVRYTKKQALPESAIAELIALKTEEEKRHTIDFDMVLANDRYEKIGEVVEITMSACDFSKPSKTDQIDRILTHRWFGLPLFGLVMFTIFYLAFGPFGTLVTDGFVWLIDQFIGLIAGLISAAGTPEWVASMVVGGALGGLSAVLGFLPQLAILFLFLSLLEDTGYMARAAFLMDRVLRSFGLSGKSFIPMLLGFGCSVPAMTSTRTLDKDDDRKITTMIIPFMSCGAKAPIYGVFAGALFAGNSYIVVFSMYLMGIVVALLTAILFKKTIIKGSSANYLLELPEYRMPTLKNTLIHTWERVKGFVLKAGTILLGAFILIWFFSYFGFVDGTFRLLAKTELEYSILGYVGKFIQPLLQPIGVFDWKATVALLTGLVARESVVGTLGILYGVGTGAVAGSSALYPYLQADFTAVQAYAYMTFALLSAPCIAALAAMRKELGSNKWFLFSLAYEMVVAYGIAALIYQIGTYGFGIALSIVFGLLAVLIVLSTIRRFFKTKGGCGPDGCPNCSSQSDCANDFKEVK